MGCRASAVDVSAVGVVAVDVNPDYVAQARVRYANRLTRLETICADVQSDSLAYEPVDLTYAALIFEYVELTSALTTLRRNSRLGGVLTTVLQLRHSTMHAVSPTPYKSLSNLSPFMTLVAPEALGEAASAAGFTAIDSNVIEVGSGKQFCVQTFRGR